MLNKRDSKLVFNNYKIYTLIFLLLATNVYGLGVHKVIKTDTLVTVFKRGNQSITINYVDLVGDNQKAKALDLQGRLQDYLDVRMKKSDMASDDPDKTTNPNKKAMFWDGDNLVGRNTLVTVTLVEGLFSIAFDTVDIADD